MAHVVQEIRAKVEELVTLRSGNGCALTTIGASLQRIRNGFLLIQTSHQTSGDIRDMRDEMVRADRSLGAKAAGP